MTFRTEKCLISFACVCETAIFVASLSLFRSDDDMFVLVSATLNERTKERAIQKSSDPAPTDRSICMTKEKSSEKNENQASPDSEGGERGKGRNWSDTSGRSVDGRREEKEAGSKGW